jgi:hypothetical protein
MPSFAAARAVIYLAFRCSIRYNVLTLELIQIHLKLFQIYHGTFFHYILPP